MSYERDRYHSYPKGGTGKTTTAGALGAALTRKGRRVLMVDMDPQANLTFTMRAEGQPYGTYEVLTGKYQLPQRFTPPGLSQARESPGIRRTGPKQLYGNNPGIQNIERN